VNTTAAAPAVEIGRLRAEEWPAYRQLRLLALEDEPTAFATEYDEERDRPDDDWIDMAGRYALSEKQRLYVARSGDVLVGMMGAQLDPTHKRAHIATVVSVFVVPERRGEGISRRLMDALIADLASVPYLLKIRLNVNPNQTRAIGLYESAGFQVVGRLEQEVRIDGELVDMLLMEKRLRPHEASAPPTS
jgi:ribosomal protein S18 acetylase RimI-like enzyme